MGRPGSLVALLLGASALACATPYMQQVHAERTLLAKYMPATLEASTRYTGEARTAKVRVYADAEYRSQNLRWQASFGDELDYANQLLEPLLGIRLEPEFKRWDRTGEASLRNILQQLALLDPGTDVAWVIGLTGSLEMVSTSTDELGMSVPLTPHLVLRGFSDVAERKAFDAALPDLGKAEREELYEARQRHKQAVVLLHELGHTLGAIHETDPSWIMHPQYGIEQATVADRNRSLMLLAIPDRITPGTDDVAATAAQLLASIEGEEWGGWVPDERQSEVEQLRNIIESGKAGQTAADVPSAVYSQFDHARTLAIRGQLDDALAELEPLIAAYPANATMRLVVCEIELRRGAPTSAAAKKACDRAIDLAAGDPRPHVTVAAAWLAAHDVAAARAELLLAEGKIANLPKPADAWAQLAHLYQGMGAIAWAEAAIDKTGAKDDPVQQWARTTRARYGVPATGKGAIKPEDEAAAVAAVRQVLDAVYASKFTDAERAARAADKKWPGLPGLLAARCDLALRQEQLGAAKKKCAAAIAADPDASWAQYLMGIIVMRGTGAKDTATGIAHLEHAIAADPDLTQAWRALAKAYDRAKNTAARDKLRADYQTRFGQALND